MKQDVFLAGMLGRLAELEALYVIKQTRKKTLWKRLKAVLSVFR